ncbi:MAG TPA: transglutaminase, partial [Acidobacteriaceae bacterium]|nr:transglutaminase [Acidobacteriaceae bacterium]
IEIPAGYDSRRLRSVITAKTGRRYLLFDPTSYKTPFGQVEHDLQGSYGVLLEGGESEAIQFPVLDPAWNTVRRSAEFRLSADGGLTGTVTENRFGDLAEDWRLLYTAEDAKQQRESLDHVLGRDLTVFAASDVKVENADQLDKDFKLSYSISADRYAKAMGTLLMVRPRVLGDLAFDELVLNPERKVRRVAIDLGQTMQVKDDYTMELPTGYVVDELPDPVDLDLGFAAYRSAVQVKGHLLHYTRTYTVRQVTLPAERFGDLQKLARTIGADEESMAVLKKE